MSDKFPTWRYGPNGQADVFECEADVPKGWQDHPSKVTKAAPAPRAPTKAAQPPKAPAKKRGRKPKAAAAPLDL